MQNLKYILFSLLLIISVKQSSAFKKHFYNKNQFATTHYSSIDNQKCMYEGERSKQYMERLLNKLNEVHFEDSMVNVLKEQIDKEDFLISSSQILQIITQFPFSSGKISAIEVIKPYAGNLQPENVVQILNFFNFSDEKLKVLKILANLLVIEQDQENKQAIFRQIVEYSISYFDRQKAYDILSNTEFRNCLFGSVTEKKVVFIIDISSNMGQTFTNSDGNSQTRLDYVKSELINSLKNMENTQYFNIIAFSTNVYSMVTESLIQISDQSVNQAINWIQAVNAGGKAYISGALDEAFSFNDDLESIYLLSAGIPTKGIKNSQTLKYMIKDYNSDKLKTVHINTICFILGGSDSDESKEKARNFLNSISKASEGTFRELKN